MRFSTPAVAALFSSFISLSAADQITVATVYRYVNATATVYQSYCPCAATAIPGLSGPSTPSTGNSGGSYVNNNAGNTGVTSGSGSGSAGSGTGSSGSGSGSSGSGSSGSGSANNGAGAGAAPGVTTYQTVIVQYVPSTQISTYTTTVVGASGQTSTVTLTNTITVTVPVTSTATVTATLGGGAGTGAQPNSAPYSNSSSTLSLSGSASSVAAGATSSLVSLPVPSLSASGLATSSILSGNAGVGADPRTATTTASVLLSTVSLQVTPVTSILPTTTAAVVSTIDPLTTTAAVVPTSTILDVTTSDLPVPASTSIPDVISTTTAAAITTTQPAATTSAAATVPTTSSTTTSYNLLATPLAPYQNNLYMSNSTLEPALYNNNDPMPRANSNPYFTFNFVPGGNTVTNQFGLFLAYDASQLAAGTQLLQGDSTSSLTSNTWVISADASSVSIAGVTFYTDPNTLDVFLTSGTPPNSYTWTSFSTQVANGADNYIPDVYQG